jgi:hypothetical protein
MKCGLFHALIYRCAFLWEGRWVVTPTLLVSLNVLSIMMLLLGPWDRGVHSAVERVSVVYMGELLRSSVPSPDLPLRGARRERALNVVGPDA